MPACYVPGTVLGVSANRQLSMDVLMFLNSMCHSSKGHPDCM